MSRASLQRQHLKSWNSRRRQARAQRRVATVQGDSHVATVEVPPYQVRPLGVRPTVCPDGVRRPVRMTRVTESSSGATFYAWGEPV